MDGAYLAGDGPSELLIAQMGNVEPGHAVTLTIVRDGDEREIEVVTRDLRPETMTLNMRDATRGSLYATPVIPFDVMRRGRWGDMELAELTPQLGTYFGTESGILVVRAPADQTLQLQDGDVILEISGRTPNDTGHAMRILSSFEPGEILELTIMRDQRRRTLEIEFPPSAHVG